MKVRICAALLCTLGLLGNCKNSNIQSSDGNESQNDSSVIQRPTIELVFETDDLHDDGFKPEESPLVKISLKENIPFDSIQLFFNELKIKTINKLPAEIIIKEKTGKTGQFYLEAHIFVSGNSFIQKFPIVFLSDIEPQIYGYEIVKIFPHDRKAYTQGLVYEDGYLYESNGMTKESTLRKLQIGTGDPIQSYTLPPEIFAEGLAIIRDKLIQISWQNYTGFVYDKKTFQIISRFTYSTEGWGLTYDGKYLIMSDGTNRLFFLDPQSYAEINRIEVYDNKGPVNQLNELEYINGEIYANIWQTDKIARIDPGTGKVTAYIELKNILSESDYDKTTDVLNGIAYDTVGKRLFVTGKRWPKMFEIKLKPKK